ncbi:ubiquitin-protein ligase [Ophiocordyceps camponoti-floridani]|uniref:Ubiquitin-protein ligase n=1 Tax=Ophiocordyceps camponoti-floridani TaxID=2030778 RepID=A0A8H4VFY9_9HYPO|nr:ubiquitin-protein ligase [Ophiocordyceps camponoti-floridani]
MADQIIMLQTSNGVEIKITRQAAERSVLIHNIMHDVPNWQHEAIPMANVNDKVLRRVVDWCEHHQAHTRTDPGALDDWDAEFMQLDVDMLFDLILAANYLEIEQLLELGCSTVASMIHDKSFEEMATLLKVPRDAIVPASDPEPEPEATDLLPYTRPPRPTAQDAFDARLLLQSRLPPELAIIIVNRAYPSWIVARRVERGVYHADDFNHLSIAGFYLNTRQIPMEPGSFCARSIVFQTRAADQGWATWGGEGTFHNSHTWFEASILRPLRGTQRARHEGELEHEELPKRTWQYPHLAREAFNDRGWDFVYKENGKVTWRVSNNLTARSHDRDYRVEWRRGVDTVRESKEAQGGGKGFLERLRPGDMVVLWARAEQRAWQNRVAAATIEIEYVL